MVACDQTGYFCRRRENHRRHLLREIYPDRVVATDGALTGQRGCSGSDNLSQVEKRSDETVVKEKSCGTAEICW